MRRDCRLKSNESYESVFSSCASSSLYTIVRVYENSIQSELQLYQESTNRLIRHSPRFNGFRFFPGPVKCKVFDFQPVHFGPSQGSVGQDKSSWNGPRPSSSQFVLRMGRGRDKFQTLRTRTRTRYLRSSHLALVRAFKESSDPYRQGKSFFQHTKFLLDGPLGTKQSVSNQTINLIFFIIQSQMVILKGQYEVVMLQGSKIRHKLKCHFDLRNF